MPWRRIAMAAAFPTVWAVLLFIAFHPGLLSNDPLYQLRQGLTGEYSFSHPPLLSFILARFYELTGSTWPALALQLLVFATCATFLAAATRWGIAWSVVFLCTVPVWATVDTIWKDVALAATLLIGVTLLFYERKRAAAPFIVCASILRLNAILAVLPLLVLVLPAKRRGLAFAGLLVVSLLVPRVQILMGARDDWPLKGILADDLAAIYSARPELYVGSMFEKEMTPDDFKAVHYIDDCMPLFSPKWPKHVDFWGLIDRKPQLTAEWLRIVSGSPGEYLAERSARFLRLLGFDGPPIYPFHTDIDPNPYGLKLTTHTMLYRALTGLRDATTRTPLFRGFTWVLLCVATLIVALRRRNQLAACVSASGLLYVAGYFFTAPATDFRYVFWTIVAGFCAVVCLLPRAPLPSQGGSANGRS
jgi:hypothetical protein